MYYIYKTKNLINNKIYIGLHKSNDINNDNYLGSGIAFLRSLKKYGRENFKREILFEFETFEEALEKESFLVNDEFIKRRDNYNLIIGGYGAEHIKGHNINKICVYSPYTNKNHYINKENLNYFLENGWVLGNSGKGKICIIKNNKIKYSTPEKLNDYLIDGWIKSNITYDKICVTNKINGGIKYINPDDLESYLNNGWLLGNGKSGVNKGRIYVNKDGKNKRIYKVELDKFLLDGWSEGFYQIKIKIKRMYNPLTNELRNIPIEKLSEYEKDGWINGNNYASNKNKIYITKNKLNKRIKYEELELYLNDGWKRGMYNKKYNNL